MSGTQVFTHSQTAITDRVSSSGGGGGGGGGGGVRCLNRFWTSRVGAWKAPNEADRHTTIQDQFTSKTHHKPSERVKKKNYWGTFPLVLMCLHMPVIVPKSHGSPQTLFFSKRKKPWLDSDLQIAGSQHWTVIYIQTGSHLQQEQLSFGKLDHSCWRTLQRTETLLSVISHGQSSVMEKRTRQNTVQCWNISWHIHTVWSWNRQHRYIGRLLSLLVLGSCSNQNDVLIPYTCSI